jgi:ubiquinone biosynthesis protein
VHERLSQPDTAPALLEETRRLRLAREQGNRLLAALTAVLALGLAVALWALTK